MRMITYKFTATFYAQERGIFCLCKYPTLYYFLRALKSLPLARARGLPLQKEKKSMQTSLIL